MVDMKRVRSLDLKGNLIYEYPSIAAAAKALGVQPHRITAVIGARVKKNGSSRLYIPRTLKGMKWEWATKPDGNPILSE